MKLKNYFLTILVSLASYFLLGCSAPILRTNEGPTKHTLGERLYIPKAQDARETPADTLISTFAQNLAQKIQDLEGASATERQAFLLELQACLQIKDFAAVQALCYIEAVELSREFPSVGVDEQSMALMLTDKALEITKLYRTI